METRRLLPQLTGGICVKEGDGSYSVTFQQVWVSHKVVISMLGIKASVDPEQPALGTLKGLTEEQARKLYLFLYPQFDFLLRGRDTFQFAAVMRSGNLPNRLFSPRKRKKAEDEIREIVDYLEETDSQGPDTFLLGFPHPMERDLSEEDVQAMWDLIATTIKTTTV